MTSGQSLALEQLRAIAEHSAGRFTLLDVKVPSAGGTLTVTLSVVCRGFPQVNGGLALRPRERFIVGIPTNFPFVVPDVDTPHKRFAGFAHVQWMRRLCLYAAPDVEWNIGDGMFGFVDRLFSWLRDAAQNRLDPEGAPLHPPVAYATESRIVVVHPNTPDVPPGGWFGLAHLRPVTNERVDVVGWSTLGEDVQGPTAAAILLDRAMPFEFPREVRQLLNALELRGVSKDLLFECLRLAAVNLQEGQPLYVLIGTPGRGVRGSGHLKQHVTAWSVDPVIARGLKASLAKYSNDPVRRALGGELDLLIRKWAEHVAVAWCQVMESRPEVTAPRDAGTSLTWCAGRVVTIWGCGALGGHVAEWLVRSHCRKLILWDHGRVSPGLLVRQPYDDSDIGRFKAEALADRLKRIRPDIEVEVHKGNVLSGPLVGKGWAPGADLLIDATASEIVLEKLEERRVHTPHRIPVLSLAIDAKAERGLAVLAKIEHSGGPRDISRRTKLEVCSRSELTHFADAFWPRAPSGEPFLPEPGCSSPTFIGSAADVVALASDLLNCGLESLRHQAHTAASHLLERPSAQRAGRRSAVSFGWQSDALVKESHSGYEVRIAWQAWAEMQGWARKCVRTAAPGTETGGLLFGERNDALRVIWVSEVIGPPPDSSATPSIFLCGTAGTKAANEEKRHRSRHSVQFIGLWHTHPRGQPLPSRVDFDGMTRVVASTNPSTPRALMLILGEVRDRPVVGAYLFSRDEAKTGQLPRRRVRGISRPHLAGQPTRIGLTLSGGGSRAIAFHLGCMRALHDRGVLDRVSVISAVSGGSVIAAMYAYQDEPFSAFDERVTTLLRQGLIHGIVRRAVFSPLALADLATTLTAGIAAVVIDAFRATVTAAAGVSGVRRPSGLEGLQAPLRRWISRTTAFERTLRDRLFHDQLLTSPRRNDLDVVMNACELRSGSAFRFGSRESGSWRYGRLQDNDVPVSQAVAASAAYPILLPAIDREYVFVDRQGKTARQRVLLTDGGVYDNLGVTCLEPGRSTKYSTNAYEVDYIICCDAGHGLFDTRPVPYWLLPRLARSFQSVFRKTQNAAQGRLHQFAASGALKGFVLSYLGQQDVQLPYLPPDLVRREMVASYPTDFSPMQSDAIEALTSRGERLTRLLLDHYCPRL